MDEKCDETPGDFDYSSGHLRIAVVLNIMKGMYGERGSGEGRAAFSNVFQINLAV